MENQLFQLCDILRNMSASANFGRVALHDVVVKVNHQVFEVANFEEIDDFVLNLCINITKI